MNETGKPLVSVLTPVYNGGKYLTECIESVLAQTYRNFEYIIVNNCSTDMTLEIAENYAALDERIKVVSNDHFVEVIENHNHAFNLMSPNARYCKVVSGDDCIFPSCLAKMVELFEASPSVGIVGSFQVSGTVVKWVGFKYPVQVIPGHEVCRRFLIERQEFIEGQPVHGFGAPTSLMYRADLVRSTRTFFPNTSPHADTSACFRVLQSCDFGFVYEVLSYERTHEETQTSASVRINGFLSASLDDLIQYGPLYLGKKEAKKRVNALLKSYHRFLIVNYFSRNRSESFWDYHKRRLRELGFPLKHSSLVKAVGALLFQEIMNPWQAIGKIRKRLALSRDDSGGSRKPIDQK